MTVRPGTPSDLPAILAIERGSATAPHWPEAAYVAALSGLGGRRVFVADDRGVQGFAVSATAAGEAELESVAVLPESRRQGVGRALCEAVIAAARAASASAILLEVRAGSESAVRLYTSLGFRVVGRRLQYYREPAEDALLMRREFGDPAVVARRAE